jgi:hypothetical protein
MIPFPWILRNPAVLAFVLLSLGSSLLSAENRKIPTLVASPPTVEVVEVGVLPTVIYNLDVHSNTFYMTAYVWFIWKGDLDPSETVEFTNNVESWGLTKTRTYPKPITFSDGRHYQCLRIEGRFFQPFSLKRFPLEHHTVSLVIEDNTYASDRILYRFDRKHSGLDEGLVIPGWSVTSWSGAEGVHHYATNLGDESVGADGSDYGTISFEVKVGRPVNFFLWKMLLPLLIILLACWTALLLHPSQLASRAAMTGTALLTTVFMQQGYTSSLPEVNYLVLMDKIYVVVYLLIIVSLIQVVIQGSLDKKHLLDDYRRALRIDKMSVIIQALFFIAAVLVITLMTH